MNRARVCARGKASSREQLWEKEEEKHTKNPLVGSILPELFMFLELMSISAFLNEYPVLNIWR